VQPSVSRVPVTDKPAGKTRKNKQKTLRGTEKVKGKKAKKEK
jgi:hypothetical protein